MKETNAVYSCESVLSQQLAEVPDQAVEIFCELAPGFISNASIQFISNSADIVFINDGHQD